MVLKTLKILFYVLFFTFYIVFVGRVTWQELQERLL